MKDFLLAALPWVIMGLATAILVVNHGTQKQTDKQCGERIALGAALGLLFGVMLNNCGLWDNHALGFAIGPLWGMALVSLFKGGSSEDGHTPGASEQE